MTEAAAAATAPPPTGSPLLRWLRRRLPLVIVVLVLVTLVAVLLWQRIFISVHPGQTGVLYRLFTGTVTQRVYPEGLHIIPPWDSMTIYETRRQVVMHSFDVLSIRGLIVHVELAIRFQPEVPQLGLLHQRIGPDYVQRVVVPQTESVLRRELSQYTAEQIYTNEGGLLAMAIRLARDEVGRNFVEADEIVIRSVALPTQVADAIEDKLTQEELLQSYEFRLQTTYEEAERKRDEARGIRDYQAAVDSTLSDRLLRHEAINAARDLSVSPNSSVIVLGAQKGGLPVLPSGQTP